MSKPHIFTSPEETLALARSMGEDFAKLRARDMLTAFFKDTGIVEDSYDGYMRNRQTVKPLTETEYSELLLDDYQHSFGQVIALAYAMGAIDAHEKTRMDIYKKGLKAEPVQTKEQPTQLTLPGFE